MDQRPLAGHVDHRPALAPCLIQGKVAPTDRRQPVVGPLPKGIGVVHQQGKARAGAFDLANGGLDDVFDFDVEDIKKNRQLQNPEQLRQLRGDLRNFGNETLNVLNIQPVVPFRLGGQPMSVALEGYANVVKPSGFSDFTARVTLKLLFPTKGEGGDPRIRNDRPICAAGPEET
jgi:hypothetical protein